VALEEFRPDAIGLGMSVEDTRSLTEHFVNTPSEPLVPLLDSESVEIRELSRYGEVGVPHPAFLAVLEWARWGGIEVEPVDPTEERYAEMFGDAIGYWELVRRTLRERRLLRAPPAAEGADAFVLAWDERLNHGAGSRRLQEGREGIVARALLTLSSRRSRVAAVIDRERVPRLLAALATETGIG
jgi:hypothetical protein